MDHLQTPKNKLIFCVLVGAHPWVFYPIGLLYRR